MQGCKYSNGLDAPVIWQYSPTACIFNPNLTTLKRKREKSKKEEKKNNKNEKKKKSSQRTGKINDTVKSEDNDLPDDGLQLTHQKHDHTTTAKKYQSFLETPCNSVIELRRIESENPSIKQESFHTSRSKESSLMFKPLNENETNIQSDSRCSCQRHYLEGNGTYFKQESIKQDLDDQPIIKNAICNDCNSIKEQTNLCHACSKGVHKLRHEINAILQLLQPKKQENSCNSSQSMKSKDGIVKNY